MNFIQMHLGIPLFNIKLRRVMNKEKRAELCLRIVAALRADHVHNPYVSYYEFKQYQKISVDKEAFEKNPKALIFNLFRDLDLEYSKFSKEREKQIIAILSEYEEG